MKTWVFLSCTFKHLGCNKDIRRLLLQYAYSFAWQTHTLRQERIEMDAQFKPRYVQERFVYGILLSNVYCEEWSGEIIHLYAGLWPGRPCMFARRSIGLPNNRGAKQIRERAIIIERRKRKIGISELNGGRFKIKL